MRAFPLRLSMDQDGCVKDRLKYEDSINFLKQDGWLSEEDRPSIPMHSPRYDDEILGLSFFRALVKDAKMENLTIPRTYFSRTAIEQTSFAGSDLTESVANWNDFEDVDFTGADLTRFDFRACLLRRVRFDEANLQDADLRCCSFEDCSFAGANLTDSKITRNSGASIILSDLQKSQISWQEDDGPEPDGG